MWTWLVTRKDAMNKDSKAIFTESRKLIAILKLCFVRNEVRLAMIGWKGRGALIEADTTGFDWPLSIESAAIVKSANRGLIHQRLSTADRQSIVRSKSRIEMRHRYLRVLLFVIVATGTIDGPDRSSCTEFYRVSEFRSS